MDATRKRFYSWPVVMLAVIVLLPSAALATELRLPSLDEPDETEILAGSPRTSAYPEIAWVYRWEKGEPYPVPFHVVRFALKMEDRGPNQVVHRQVRGSPYEVLGSETPNKVLVWLPAGFDLERAYYETWEYINDPDGLTPDALHAVDDFSKREVQIFTTEEEYLVRLLQQRIIGLVERLSDYEAIFGTQPGEQGDGE